jgi:GxxExxY protein
MDFSLLARGWILPCLRRDGFYPAYAGMGPWILRIRRIFIDFFLHNQTSSFMELKHSEITEQVIGAYYDVYNDLGYGFLERVYQNALYFELLERGLKVEAQKSIKVYRNGRLIGNYYADLLINGAVIVELKAVATLTEAHEKQLVNYLKATNMEVGLLINFGLEPKFERKTWSNERKKHLQPNQKQNPQKSA